MPRRLERHFRSYGSVLTVTDAGLSGFTNGQLLRRIAGDFDVFITIDKSIQHQQTLSAFDVAFVLLRVPSNDIVDVEPVLPRLFSRWEEFQRRSLLIID